MKLRSLETIIFPTTFFVVLTIVGLVLLPKLNIIHACYPKTGPCDPQSRFVCQTGSGNFCCNNEQEAINEKYSCTNFSSPTPTGQLHGCRPKESGCDSNTNFGSMSFLCQTNNGDFCCQSYQTALDNNLSCNGITPTPTSSTPGCRQLTSGSCNPGGMGVPNEWECDTHNGTWCCQGGPQVAANNNLQCTNFPKGVGPNPPYQICNQIPDTVKTADGRTAKQACIDCLEDNGDEGLWTAVGCIKIEPTKVIQALIRLGLGAAGGVALLSLLAGGFMFSVSEGDPKRVGQAKELIVASLTGLLFIIFSVTLLQFIGWSILKIPGFGG